MKGMAAALLLIAAGPARAHSGDAGFAFTEWEPWITLPLLVATVLYARGLARLWRRARTGAGVSGARAACFAGGVMVLIADFVSPLHALADRYFVAHMGEHQVLMALAAPLFALSRPLAVMLWGLPPRWRAALSHTGRRLVPIWRALTRPTVATALHAVAIWTWHVPALFDAALADAGVHALQHLSFLGSALLFWSALFEDRHARRYGAAMLYLFVTSVHTSLLGALLVFAPRTWYARGDAGLAPLDDQQLGGLLMWVPGGFIYGVAALALGYQWIVRRAPMRPDARRSDAAA